jgi:hypothetical protein
MITARELLSRFSGRHARLKRVLDATPPERHCELCDTTRRVLLLRNGGLICESCRDAMRAQTFDSIGE